MAKKKSYKGSTLFGMKHTENPGIKNLNKISKAKVNKNYSRNQKGK